MATATLSFSYSLPLELITEQINNSYPSPQFTNVRVSMGDVIEKWREVTVTFDEVTEVRDYDRYEHLSDDEAADLYTEHQIAQMMDEDDEDSYIESLREKERMEMDY